MEYGTQMSLFDGTEDYKITKPIRLIEMFAGYGSQALALKYLGANFEHWKISEWAAKSIQAYKDMHFPNATYDLKSIDIPSSKEWLKGRISTDYSTPIPNSKIDKMSDSEIRTIISNMKITHNLGSICSIKGSDLEITDTDKYTYIMTYSFPCQDLSLAGLGGGMVKGSGTRSGLLWEVERILDELQERPQVLLMENVPQVHGADNIKSFSLWLKKLESLGYKCYWQDLNAKDYGVPQNRDRCFMVSILGDYFYEFPRPIKLEKRLKDLLEKDVDEKYYLSDNIINYFTQHSKDCEEKGLGFRFTPNEGESIGRSITTLSGNRMDDNFIKEEDSGGINASMIVYGEDFMKTTDIKEQCKNGTQYRIRKLTPKECFRLMGVKDEDFENVAKNQSNASLYHLAGDSIVVDVLKAIFNQML